MATPLLETKLYVPPVRPEMVQRPRLIERLNAGLHRKLTLISAPAGFGKTTLLSEWVADCGRPVAWLSLDEGDNDPTRFWAYFVAALQTLALSLPKGKPKRGIVAERTPETLRRPQGASSGLLAAEGGVDEFAKRRRTALKGLREPQNCHVGIS